MALNDAYLKLIASPIRVDKFSMARAKAFVPIFRRPDNGHRWLRVKKSYSGQFFPAVV